MFRSSLFLALTLSACTAEPEVSGRADYGDYCAACHGTSGKGDGPAAAGLGKRPADLTQLTARNNGTFPQVRVMSVIDGYTRRGGHGVMPEFGALLEEGPLEMVETGNGILTPTPVRLVALAAYLQSLQAR